MATPQEIEELKALENDLDLQLQIIRDKIDSALARELANKKLSYRNNAIDYYMQQLYNVRHILNPETRQNQYNILIHAMVNNPQKYIEGFIDIAPQNWKDFTFSDEEKAAFDIPLSKIEDIQRQLNAKKSAISVRENSAAPVLSSSEEANHKRIREQLDKNIEALKELEKKLEKTNSVKALYKKAKKATLASYDKEHKSKLELVRELKDALVEVSHDAEKHKLETTSTGHSLMSKVRAALDEFEPKRNKRIVLIKNQNDEFSKLMNDIRQPHFLSPRKNIQQLTQAVIQTANNETKFKKVSDDKRLQDHINANKEKNKGPSKALDPNVKLGELLSLYLPSALVKRDQLAIDALTDYIQDFERKDNPVVPKSTNYHFCRVISHLNTLENSMNMINLKMLEFEDPDVINGYLHFEVDIFNRRCQEINDSIEAINDPSLSKMMEEQLKQLQDNFTENLPQAFKDTPEYQALKEAKLTGSNNPVVALNAGIYQDILRRPLAQLDALEVALETKPHSVKAKYKEVKKHALEKMGKKHNTKHDIVQNLRSELNAINNALENKNAPITEKQLQQLLLNAIKNVESLQQQRIELRPKEMRYLNAIIDDLKGGLAQFESAKRKLKN